jgi:DNA-binding FadR family transcriptional regulator
MDSETSSDDAAPAPAFASVERDPRLSDRVAGSLTEAILQKQFAVGDRLPSERALMEQFNVSRTVVREAVRSLLATGIVVAAERRGIVVSSVPPDTITKSMTLYLRHQPEFEYHKLSDLRQVLEVAAASRAAEHATPRDLKALRAAFTRMDDVADGDEAAQADLEFHGAIAKATGNEFFSVVLDSLRTALLDAQRPALAQPDIRAHVREAHLAILERITDGDPVGASNAMLRHLEWAELQIAPLLGRG